MKKRFATLLAILVLVCSFPALASAQDEKIHISTAKQLVDVLNMTSIDESNGKTYVLDNDLTINPEDISDEERIFAGNIEGGNHTITIKEDSNNPLFDRLRGSVKDLDIIFEKNVMGGVPFARDAGYKDKTELITLENISVTVKGDVLYGNHDYTKYYGKNLTGENRYGNWYINFNGQPVHLASGFAWYLWGASIKNVDVNINGNVGESEAIDGDAAAVGFAYFALKGSQENETKYENIDVNIGKDIVTNTGYGHAQSYGFAVGTTDRQMFGGYFIDEVNNVNISAKNIIASSDAGASTAMGFAKDMQGTTHECNVNVENSIKATNNGPNKELEPIGKKAYFNGQSYASGFTNITWAHLRKLRDFYNNEVNVGEIYSETKSPSKKSNGSAKAHGFANQLYANDVNPNVSYNNNRVIVKNNIYAHSNVGDAFASGFVSNTTHDGSENEDHIHSNSVKVLGSIIAISDEHYSTAAGYGYSSKTHIRNCDVYVGKDIIAKSPIEAISVGMIGRQYLGYHYFLKDCKVTVDGQIKAVQTRDGGEFYASGLIGAIFNQGFTYASPTVISGNTVNVKEGIFAEGNNKGEFCEGLFIAINLHKNRGKVAIELDNNTFIGKESLIENDEKATDFTNSVNVDVYSSAANNKVVFLRENDCPYSADITLDTKESIEKGMDIWPLSNIQVDHQINEQWSFDEKSHWHECQCGIKSDEASHTFEWVVDKEPTHTEEGSKHEECTVCSYAKESVEIPVTAHNFGKEWINDETNHWHQCECGAKSEEATHTFEWVVDKEATHTEEGSKHEACTVCGYAKEGVEIPPLGPQTPDVDKPSPDKPEPDEPDLDKLGTDKPDVEKPGTDKPDADKPGLDKPDSNKPDADKPAASPDKENVETGDQAPLGVYITLIAICLSILVSAHIIRKKIK